ncbi:MAG: TetR/AcrR family transcriptional regulator, partial [Burkholderiaceae bacterium]
MQIVPESSDPDGSGANGGESAATVARAPAARQTRRYQEKREAILGAAARLFNQKGVKGGTLADVAQSVGLITNSVTYYYRRKEDLAKACLLRSIETVDGIAARAAADPDPRARPRRFIEAYFDVVRQIALGERPELMHFHDLRALQSPHSDEVFAAYTDMFRRLRRLLETACPPGIDRRALNARAHLLLTQSLWARTWARRYAPEDYPLACERTCDILMHGIGAAGVRWRDDLLPGILDEPARGAAEEAGAIGAADVTPEAFLRAATYLVNEHGYHGASVDKISARLNVTKGSFYHHNDNKEDLIVACFEQTFSVMRQAFDAAARSPGSGWERLGLAARTLIAFQFSDRGPLLRHSAWSVLPAELRYDKRR